MEIASPVNLISSQTLYHYKPDIVEDMSALKRLIFRDMEIASHFLSII